MLIIIAAFNACAPLKEFGTTQTFQEPNNFEYNLAAYDSSKKTVIIVANNDGTELFDMMAPYYLFNATQKANVYIVAKNKFPIVVKKGFFILPQSTFNEIDSLKIKPDVIVVPFLSIADSIHQDAVIINWIKQHYTPNVKLLSICDGAATAAATGIFDGKPITAHASDYEGVKAHFSKPLWVQNKSVVNNGNLYSTAGVSNAVEGSLMVINELFGSQTMTKVIHDINYPYSSPKIEHQSNTFHFGDKVTIGKKIIFKKNKKVGVLLQDSINEFELAAVMDTYNRTFPKSIMSFSINNAPVKTKYGLTLIPSGKINSVKLDELHMLESSYFLNTELLRLNSCDVVKYNNTEKQYIIDKCLQRIYDEHGKKFQTTVKLMLDYN